MKLIMIMGMQRSGTTALFETLRTAPMFVSYEESFDSLVYDDYFLRPESSIRTVLCSSGCSVLLKPVRESARRTLVSVIDEYAAYDLSVIWLYRDPVNVVFSYSVKGWLEATTVAMQTVALQWVARNRLLTQIPNEYRPKLIVLRYEELVSDTFVLKALKRKLGMGGNSTLRADSNAGRSQLPIATQKRIDAITSETLLDLYRFPTGLDFARNTSWGRKRLLATIQSDERLEDDAGAAHAEASRESAEVDFESESFQRDPYDCLTRLREYRRHHLFESGSSHWLSEYDDVSCALRDSQQFSFKEGRLLEDSVTFAEERFCEAIADVEISGSAKLTANLEGLAQEAFARQLQIGRFNLAKVCVMAVADMFYGLLGVGHGDPNGLFEQIIRGESIDTHSSHFMGDGLISRVATVAPLSSADFRRFLEFGSYYHWVTAIFAINAVHFLLEKPALLSEIRRAPGRFSATFTELLRLAYPLLVVERWTSGTVKIGGRKIPAHTLVYLSIGAANRDPAAFERPDEFFMGRDLNSTKKPLSGYTGACFARAHWEEWGHLVCETLLMVLLTRFPVLEPVHLLSESKFTISPSSGGLRRALQIPFLRYLQTFEVKFQT